MLGRGSLHGLLADAEASCLSIGTLGKPSPGGAMGGYPEPASSGPGLGSADNSGGPALSLEATSQPTVCGLRDRLLREAKNERLRCLEVAEAAERRRVEFRGLSHASTQTDITTDVVSGSFSDASPRRGVGLPVADRDEDEEQMEAIRTLAKLGELSNQSQCKEATVSELSRQIQTERQQREKFSTQLAIERSSKSATAEQVMCLENELDNREAALQAAEDALERRTEELEQALLRICVLEEACGHSPVRESMVIESQWRLLRSQLNEKEHQLEQKDRQISRLHAHLRTRGVFLEEDSTTCGSERSMALTCSALSTRASSPYSQLCGATSQHPQYPQLCAATSQYLHNMRQ